MTQVSSHVVAAAFPHVNLSELSARKGNEGNPRYVPMKDGNLGDTNTGLVVFACKRKEDLRVRSSALDDLQEEFRERLAIVNGD